MDKLLQCVDKKCLLGRRYLDAKKMTYFLESIRNEFRIGTDKFNEDFFRKLSGKTGVDVLSIKELCD